MSQPATANASIDFEKTFSNLNIGNINFKFGASPSPQPTNAFFAQAKPATTQQQQQPLQQSDSNNKVEIKEREDYFRSHFEQVSSAIRMEHETLKLVLDNHYKQMLTEVATCEAQFLKRLNASYVDDKNGMLDQNLQMLRKYQGKLSDLSSYWQQESKSNSNSKSGIAAPDPVFASMKSSVGVEHERLCKRVDQLEGDMKEAILGEQAVLFKPYKERWPLGTICGHLERADSIDSRILNARLKRTLKEISPNRLQRAKKFSLIYRASRDGFAAADFHAKCDNVARTLTVVKTTHGCIFGGYTEKAWSSPPQDAYLPDCNAFIFSLTNVYNRPALAMPCKLNQSAICCSAKAGATFGNFDGVDFQIANNSNTTKSRSQLGNSYEFKLDESYEADVFLAGARTFLTTEIEVYAIEPAPAPLVPIKKEA